VTTQLELIIIIIIIIIITIIIIIIPPIMIINRIYETQNFLSLYLIFFLVGLRTYQHPCKGNDLNLVDLLQIAH